MKKDEGAWQGYQAAKNDDLQNGVVPTNPFNRNILEGKDKHRQHQGGGSSNVGAGFRHIFSRHDILFNQNIDMSAMN
jgi:hypothetical protein